MSDYDGIREIREGTRPFLFMVSKKIISKKRELLVSYLSLSILSKLLGEDLETEEQMHWRVRLEISFHSTSA